ncbi:MAG TPA: DNA polymerase III subunit gamma/tau [Candidatus Saccharimonadales bacterium]|nr:DNA polymerase III subunit gamma/tau [Candidatus Saccharimonadales bacterium]
MVFYRKYRPQIIDDLDSTSVRETLAAVLSNDVPHAFLFTGPKGLGKTSTARIVAKVVNCTTDKSKRKNGIEPCDVCDACTSIKNGTNIDILEIDAASNRGIDEIRELKEKIRLAPVLAFRKVYIIDEVHMLTTEAFNALLKTLEEPPAHAMFILCTTESHKVPETIVSRCFQIVFKKATNEELIRSLQRIVTGEKLDVGENVLKEVANMADGGFRDAAKMIEELSLFAKEGKITQESLEKSHKVTKIPLQVTALLTALKENNIQAGLEIIQELVAEGIDLKFFISQVIAELHALLLATLNIESSKNVTTQSLKLQPTEIKMFIMLMTNAYQEMKNAVLPQLPLELAVIEWCEMRENPQAQNSAPSSPSKSYVAEITEVSVDSLRRQVGAMQKMKALYGEPPLTKQKVTDDESIVPTSVELMHTSGDGTVTKEWLDAFWRNLIVEVKKHNHTVAGVLRGCVIKSFADQKLVIQTSYKFHKERLEDMKNFDSLMKGAKLLTGKDIQITVELKK